MLNNLIEWEKSNGFKACYVAEKLGLTPSQYSKLKHGHTRPSVEIVERLEKEFNVSNATELLKNFKGGD